MAHATQLGQRLVDFVASKMLFVRTGDAPNGYENRSPHRRHNPSHWLSGNHHRHGADLNDGVDKHLRDTCHGALNYLTN